MSQDATSTAPQEPVIRAVSVLPRPDILSHAASLTHIAVSGRITIRKATNDVITVNAAHSAAAPTAGRLEISTAVQVATAQVAPVQTEISRLTVMIVTNVMKMQTLHPQDRERKKSQTSRKQKPSAHGEWWGR